MAVPAEYNLILTTDTGSRLANPFQPIGRGFRADRKANTISPCSVELPYEFDQSLFTVANPREYMLQVWRKADGGTMKLFNNYLILHGRRKQNPTPNGSFWLFGYDMNILLYRRIVAAYKASAQSRITEAADDMIKTLMTNAMSDANAPVPEAGTRAWPGLTVSEKTTSGPSLLLDLQWEELLTFSGGGAFKKIVNASRDAGTDLFFEVQPNLVLENSIDFILNTYITQIGQDLTDTVTFSTSNSTVENAQQDYDYSRSKNYMYGGGEGQDDCRTVVQSYNAADYLRGKYSRSEGFNDEPSVDDDSLQNDTDSELRDNKRIIKVKGDLVDTPQLRFGRDFDFGDLVTVQMFEDQYEAMITAVTIGMEDGRDIVEIDAEYRQ